jgi:gamma-glutamyl hercynylcysteine S-oxide hydrolase
VCRLLAYLGAPTSPRDLVFGGDHSLYEQSWAPAELISGSVNADGYGIAWYANGRPARIAEARPIWYDSDLRDTLAAVESGVVIAALRNGTPGIPVDRSGLLPLVHGDWSFVLNGYVPDFRSSHMRAMRSALPDDLYAALRGTSDSETLFLLTVAEVRDGSTLVEALTAVTLLVCERVGTQEAQLNMVITDGVSIGAVRTSSVLRTNSLYAAERPPFASGGVVLASERPETSDAWVPVEPHTSLSVAADGSITTAGLALD